MCQSVYGHTAGLKAPAAVATGSAVAVTPDRGLVARAAEDAEHPNEADEPQGNADEDDHEGGGESKDGRP